MKGKEVLVKGDLVVHCKCGHKQECPVEIKGPNIDTEIYCLDCDQLVSTISVVREYEPGLDIEELITVTDVSQESGAMIRVNTVRERMQ